MAFPGGAILDLAIAVLKFVNTAHARKYHNKLFKLRKRKAEYDSLPPEEVDDVAYVTLLTEIDLTAEAALNDPAINPTT